MESTGYKSANPHKGQSLIELALILPLLLMLVFGVIDYGRAIQFNNILAGMSREGANLAARTSDSVESRRNIIVALINTAEPLVMATHGMVYITQITGSKVDKDCTGNACAIYQKVQEQIRAVSGDHDLPSKVWTCSGWSNHTCHAMPSTATATLPLTIAEGETVYAVEVLYDYNVLVNYVMSTGPELYSLTVL